MSEVKETLIRARAYEIWLREGCPDDAADRHWYQAVHELIAETGVDPSADAVPDAPVKARPKKAAKAEAGAAVKPKVPKAAKAPKAGG